jgi:hypothetical protein
VFELAENQHRGKRAMSTYQIELANKIGRINGQLCAIGTEYIVTQRALGRSGALARLPTREAAAKWIAEREAAHTRETVRP